MMSHHNSQRGSLIDDQITHDMQCNSLLWSSSLDALCVCFAIFFVFMEVFCFFQGMQTASSAVLPIHAEVQPTSEN